MLITGRGYMISFGSYTGSSAAGTGRALGFNQM